MAELAPATVKKEWNTDNVMDHVAEMLGLEMRIPFRLSAIPDKVLMITKSGLYSCKEKKVGELEVLSLTKTEGHEDFWLVQMLRGNATIVLIKEDDKYKGMLQEIQVGEVLEKRRWPYDLNLKKCKQNTNGLLTPADIAATNLVADKIVGRPYPPGANRSQRLIQDVITLLAREKVMAAKVCSVLHLIIRIIEQMAVVNEKTVDYFIESRFYEDLDILEEKDSRFDKPEGSTYVGDHSI